MTRRAAWLAEDERKWDIVMVHQRVLMHPDLTIYDRGVYFVLAWHANAETGESRPGQPTIGKEAGCSERRVRTAVGILEATGLVRIIREPGKPIIYRLLSPPKHPVRLTSADDRTPAGGAALLNGPRQEVPHSADATPAGGANGPRQEVPQNNKESLNEEEPKEALKASTPAIATSETPRAKPPPKLKAPPNPDVAPLVAHFAEIADTSTLRDAVGYVGGKVKKSLSAGATVGQIREALDKTVRDGNPSAFGRFLTGIERRDNHRAASPDTPLARGVLALAAAAKAGERWDGEEAQSLEQIAQRFDLTGGAEQ